MSLLIAILSLCPATLAERDGYTVCYDTANHRALWTTHQPRPSSAPTQRRHWRKDHELNSLPTSAFTNSGFDRGHLANAADLPESSDTFLTSNAVPQNRTLNRGAWRALENEIRKQRPALVLTGAIYANCGNEKIEAPCYLFKIAHLPNGQILAHFAENAPPAHNPNKTNTLQPRTQKHPSAKNPFTKVRNLYSICFQQHTNSTRQKAWRRNAIIELGKAPRPNGDRGLFAFHKEQNMKLSKSEQARLNGAKSKGAKTPEGLERCRQASITHGMYVADLSTFPHEDQRNYAAIWTAARDQFQPRNAFEDALVSLLADATWRSMRLGALANADISREMSVIGRQAMNDIEPVEVHLRAEQQSKTVERLESRGRHYTREIIRITELLRKLRTLPVSAEASQVVEDIYESECPTPRENPIYPPQPTRKPVNSVNTLPQKVAKLQI